MKNMERFLVFAFTLTMVALARATLQKQALHEPRKLSCYATNMRVLKFPVHFFLSTGQVVNLRMAGGPQRGYEIDANLFDRTLRTTVIVHGYLGKHNDEWVKELRDTLLDRENMNVITVDWNRGFPNSLDYIAAAFNTEYTAFRLKELFRQIVNSTSTNEVSSRPLGYVHFIGFSLGAHVVGHAAELLKRENIMMVDRVTGLDPAEPCFNEVGLPLRLHKDSAKFVDIVHTDSALQPNSGFGIWKPLGHADFYLNGGYSQPGCYAGSKRTYSRTIISIETIIIHSLLENGACNHHRATQYFTESIKQHNSNGCKFWAHPWTLGLNLQETKRSLASAEPCDSSRCVEMGINAELYANRTGIYFVRTRKNPPFCTRPVRKALPGPLQEHDDSLEHGGVPSSTESTSQSSRPSWPERQEEEEELGNPPRKVRGNSTEPFSPADVFHMLSEDDSED